MPMETYLIYLAAVAVFFATPPDTSQLLIISNSVRHGLRRRGKLFDQRLPLGQHRRHRLICRRRRQIAAHVVPAEIFQFGRSIGGIDLARHAVLRTHGRACAALAGKQCRRKGGEAGVAHDLRSPLTRLRNRLEAGLKETEPDAQVAALARSIDDVDGVLATFNAILRLSRVQAGATGSFRRLNLVEIADELSDLYEPVCEEQGLAFEYVRDGELWVHADRDLVAQAMANLLDNAVSFSPADAPIEVIIDNDGTCVTVLVADSGPGIPEDAYEKVFQRFHSVRPDKEAFGNHSGLGLAIARAIAEAHDGTLTAEARPDGKQGACLRLRLPAAA